MTTRRLQLVAQSCLSAVAANTIATFPAASLAMVSTGAFVLTNWLRVMRHSRQSHKE
jgi:hypothetical protein